MIVFSFKVQNPNNSLCSLKEIPHFQVNFFPQVSQGQTRLALSDLDPDYQEGVVEQQCCSPLKMIKCAYCGDLEHYLTRDTILQQIYRSFCQFLEVQFQYKQITISNFNFQYMLVKRDFYALQVYDDTDQKFEWH
ncbi:hypothetical protein ABPG72_020051 [Tetrahymena utriculariae]